MSIYGDNCNVKFTLHLNLVINLDVIIKAWKINIKT